MIYVLNTKLNENKSIFFSLTGIFGIGQSKSFEICKKLGFSKNLILKEMTPNQINSLISFISKSKIIINKDLKKMKALRIKHLISIKSYRGLRLKQKLPVRGQRTHTNAKTAKKKLR